MQNSIPTPQSVPSVQELDAAWPAIKKRFDDSRERVLDAAWQVVEAPSDTGYFRDLERAVEENRAAEVAECDFHRQMAAAQRRELGWLPDPDRRSTWEVTS